MREKTRESISCSGASAFLGHSERVAQKHYWQVTDEDFKQRAQNWAQMTRARSGTRSQGMTGENDGGPTLPEDAPPCDLRQDSIVGDTRLELVQQSPRKQAITLGRDAEYDARCAELGAVDADLSELITLAPAVGGQCTGSSPSAGHTVTYQRPLEGPLWAPDLEVLYTPIGVCRRQEFAHAPPGCNKYP